ncbi:MarR family transcriptional regulator [Streptomyces sp. Li-HN-5-11]|uniref:MarR family winged helix-turn-helix transcriptional regulator n=1 Tax=Streptomyces sp. Li-HN-5-11 TaxID=3075432 RepID=UPI0028A927AB|nr:MarR family transcriptional regulator [Streptomyces sp. Li-HN-5-11]WNM35735.1 MarR family transcriptional regulator [Streptomyces sp. Li-HN-5-11]
MIDLERLHQDLVRLETELWNTLDARLRVENGLPLTWFMVMRYLAQRPGLRIQDIAHEFAITAGGTSKVIDRIEAAGYCRRRPHPNDRRSAVVELTPDGLNVVSRAAEGFEAELRRQVGSAASEQSLTQFAATLSALRSALSSPAGRRQTSDEPEA